jgi:hypothetical protein
MVQFSLLYCSPFRCVMKSISKRCVLRSWFKFHQPVHSFYQSGKLRYYFEVVLGKCRTERLTRPMPYSFFIDTFTTKFVRLSTICRQACPPPPPLTVTDPNWVSTKPPSLCCLCLPTENNQKYLLDKLHANLF